LKLIDKINNMFTFWLLVEGRRLISLWKHLIEQYLHNLGTSLYKFM